jgi:vancomycin resistance protein VanJ
MGVPGGVGAALFVLWVVGQVARDRTLPTALLFYVPSAVVAAVVAGLALVARWRRQAAWPLALAALAPAAVALGVENRWAPAPPPARRSEVFRVVHWNVSGGWVGAAEQAREIARRDPDLVVLSEGPERVARRVLAELPGFTSRSFGSLSLLARALDGSELLERGPALQVVGATVPWRELKIRILAVNLGSALLQPRAPSLERVLELVRARRPDLVVGDFNAPRRSRALADLPAGWRHAYDEAGHGWSASWPMPVPLLAIDQALVGPRFQAAGYRLAGTPWSDHRLQQIDLAPLASPARD